LLQIEKATIGYGEKIVLKNINISITPKERIAIIGPNGAGKSSLIKLLAGELLAIQGTREASSGLKIGYFAQHQVDHLHLGESPLEHLRHLAKNSLELDLRKYLGSFGFSGDSVLEPVKNFSGGEKSRLALALLVWQKPNLLLLDEPTNHLDLEMRQALSLALQEYEGAMILITHDRFLVRSTTDQLLLAAEGDLQPFNGDLEDYERWLLEYRKEQVKGRREESSRGTKLREGRRPSLQTIKRLEDELEKLQKAYNNMENQLADHSLYEVQNKDKLQQKLLEQEKLKQELSNIENAWLQACEKRDKFL
jgi:ATP-binding cassette subfamily F protein 3